MIHTGPLEATLPDWPLHLIETRFSPDHHGDYPRWSRAIEALPTYAQPCAYEPGDSVHLQLPELSREDTQSLANTLQAFHPWRKGPFQVGPVFIDTEWRSDWKWQRIANQVPMQGRVLDIGCGNGYFGWRMLAAGADQVVGIDPTLLFCMQHQTINHFIRSDANWVLPLGVEEIPQSVKFDRVVSMGVIYHRKDPAAHVRSLYQLCAPQGIAILESLIVEGQESLIPTGRYARMRNVWCVPNVEQMRVWMRDAGFDDVEVIDVSPTTTAEQRSTPWMRFESLAQALDPRQPDRTIEGHPAPVRAVVVGYRR